MIAPNEPTGGRKADPKREVPEGLRCEFPFLKRPLDSANHFGVGASGEQFGIMKMPVRWLARDEAINLAVWLVTIADPERTEFERIWREVKK